MARWDKSYIKIKKKTSKVDKDPPIFDLKVRNPITYIRNWWKKIIGNEGVEIKIKVRPITTLLIVALVLTGTYGLGILTGILSQVPYIKDVLPSPTSRPISTQAPSQWKETAFSGTLRYSSVTRKYYLSTTSSEAITLEVPDPVDIEKLIGKKIFAVGSYNKTTDILKVTDITSLVILPASIQPIPTLLPTPAENLSE